MLPLMTRRQRGPSGQVLIAGLGTDTAAVRRLAENLPADAYGHVLLEDAPARPLRTPDRVSVHLMPSDSSVPGARLAQALGAWAGEWLADGEHGLHEQHQLRIGGRGSRPVDLVRAVLVEECCGHVAHLTMPVALLPIHQPQAVRA